MRVSIGLPFYNSELTLTDAIRSVFAQTFQDWELILVDDGSHDKSLEIALAVDDPRVRVLRGEANLGLSYRLNQIAWLAQGEYIARMDADDMMHPERLAQQVHFLDMNPTVNLVSTAMYIVDSTNTLLGVRGTQPLTISPKAILEHGVIHHPTVMGQAKWFRSNLYSLSYQRAEDRELWCRTYPYSTFAIMPSPLHFYREDGTNNVKKYILSYRSERRIFRKYGPTIVGWQQTTVLTLKSHLKSFIQYCLAIFKARKILYKIQNISNLTDTEINMANKIIAEILATPIPGFSTL